MSDILNAMKWRYAVKEFDAAKNVSDGDLKTILETARLAPSSIGLEPWKFFVVENAELRAKLRAASWNQTKVTDASHLLVIAYRTDARVLPDELMKRAAAQQGVPEETLAGWRQMAEGGAARPDAVEWLRRQAYIPLGMMIETAALLGVDSCPMEGFDVAQVDEILGLKAQNLSATAMLAIGYRGNDPTAARPKVRRTPEDVIRFVK